jgi:hypothetical protein
VHEAHTAHALERAQERRDALELFARRDEDELAIVEAHRP